MTSAARALMSVHEFLDWAPHQEGRWELYGGVPLAMAPERVIHGQSKGNAYVALRDAIARSRLPCEALPDSTLVRIDRLTSYQPDVMVHCAGQQDPDALEIADPIIVLEVLSPSTAMRDLRDKLVGYFRVASISHYLIVDPDERLVIHHARGVAGALTTRILRDGAVRLDPPGLEVQVIDLLPPVRESRDDAEAAD